MNTLGARILSEKLKCNADLRPAFAEKDFSGVANGAEAILTINRTSPRFLLVTDIYIWFSGTPDQVRMTIRAKGVTVPPWVNVIPMTLNSAQATAGQMSTLLEGISLLFAPDESPVEIAAKNVSGGVADVRIYAFALTVESLPAGSGLENWKYADLSQGV
jgi:hypothetical protein